MHVFMPRFITRSMMISTMIRLIMVCLVVIILAFGGYSGKNLSVCQNKRILENYAYLSFNTSILSGLNGNCSCKIGEDLYVCKKKTKSGIYEYLHFNTSILSGIDGSCSCKFSFEGTTYIEFETDALMFPNCTDGDIAFNVIAKKTITFTCDNNNGIHDSSEQELIMVEQNPGDEVWLIMSRTEDSPLLSGSIVISSRTIGGSLQGPFSMSCYEPNVNIPSIPTTQETSTYLSPTTSTTSTASTASTTSPRITRLTSTIISTTSTSSSAATTTKLPGTSIFPSSSKIHESSFRSTTSLIISTSHDKPTANPESLKENPAAAIAGGIAGGLILLAIVIIGCVVFHRRYRIIRRTDNNQSPESRDHPTYCDLSNRENTEYEHIDRDKGPNENYQNFTLDVSE